MIADLIDEFLREEDDHEPSGKLSPSALYGCERKAILRQRKVPPTWLPDPQARRVFAMGRIVEDFILDILEKKGALLGRAVEIGDDLWKGVIDAVVQGQRGPFILEVKSVHSRAFWWNRKDKGMPYEAHIYQAMAYHHFYGGGSPHILYVSKDDLCLEEYVVGARNGYLEVFRITKEWPDYQVDTVAPVKAIPDELEERMRTLERHAREGTVPEAPFPSPDEHPYLCQRKGEINCTYWHYCWAGKEIP